jgi:hypothetical protein
LHACAPQALAARELEGAPLLLLANKLDLAGANDTHNCAHTRVRARMIDRCLFLPFPSFFASHALISPPFFSPVAP